MHCAFNSVHPLRTNLNNRPIRIKLQRRNTNLPMETGAILLSLISRIDSMIHDIPSISLPIFPGHTEHRIMSRSNHTVSTILYQHYRTLSHLNRTKRRVRRSVCHMIVWRSRIIHRPHEIILPIAIEHVRSLPIAVILQRATLRSHHRDSLLLYRFHIRVQLSPCHIAVAPIEIRFAGNRVGEDIHVDLLAMVDRRLGDERLGLSLKRTGRRVCYSNSYLLGITSLRLGTEI